MKEQINVSKLINIFGFVGLILAVGSIKYELIYTNLLFWILFSFVLIALDFNLKNNLITFQRHRIFKLSLLSVVGYSVFYISKNLDTDEMVKFLLNDLIFTLSIIALGASSVVSKFFVKK
ncbi:MAG: hypothetical protein ABNH21_13085 [Glaciecola sp.]